MENIMKHIILSTSLLFAALQMMGCMVPVGMQPNLAAQMNSIRTDSDLYGQKLKIVKEYQVNPDTDAWHEQRQKLSQAKGDRVFDKDYGRVFDSLVLAVSTLELKVNNMERTSGYLQASDIALPPTESKAMHHDALRDWCLQNGSDPSILDKQLSNSDLQTSVDRVGNSSGMMGQPVKAQKGLTFQLVKMRENQTKVKLRFSDVYYPAEMEAYYKLIWQAVDKQIFVDKNVEGAVEERK